MSRARAMMLEFWEFTKAFGLAIGVHVLAAALIVLGTMNWKPHRPPQLTGMTIEAVMVDTQQIKDRRDAAQREAEQAQRREDARLQRERDLEAQRQREQRQAEAEQQRQADAAAEAQRQREREEAQRKRDAELRLQQLREQQEKDRQDKLQQQQQELEQLRQQREEAEAARKLEEERLKQIAARREQQEAAERQAQQEAAARAQADAEAQAFRAGQLATLSDEYSAAIQSLITSNWMRPPTAQAGLECILNIVQIPGGEVISTNIRGRCNGDEATRRSLIQAVERAGSLPYRGFEDVFVREIDFRFIYDGD